MKDAVLPRDAVAIVGRGRLGSALSEALASAGCTVGEPLGRGADPQAPIVLLCVPDREIAAAASAITPRSGRRVGHCSGATTLALLHPHEAFGLHPLMTVPGAGADFAGATAAVDGGTARALEVAERLATALGMVPVRVRDDDRAAYHAAASIASNFLLTLEDFAERLAASAGLPRERLLPMVRATVANWATDGAPAALTGPVARGDAVTVARQRTAVAERAPEDLELFDALVSATHRLAHRKDPA
ncbi:Rossmann-like and DUF2520 domain-containing protein [Tessaracoccus sp. ZS01]|uniref:Rossmann-like and DUF2520 domain-containing protein n=1 Tax=Tessaracoccus sp. ZS01 TaxID=1906324 RepID=UPI00096F680C|nr:Rossmann-like and DUF2520 domain-containing protein [Tessaracoccus sp. ZS01]MCG6567852.1 DUF2520 domain-containing protein [Tessaracoccus sp. ZS01]OMG55337.1 stilbene synthase [Tessaracoccus sp. ZS01]